jgi:uncharacterized DUF497 family protein
MDVRWDPATAKANLKKHGVRFSDAESVLFDPLSLSMEDASSESEQRFTSIGLDSGGRVVVIVYTHRGDDIRLNLRSTRESKRDPHL